MLGLPRHLYGAEVRRCGSPLATLPIGFLQFRTKDSPHANAADSAIASRANPTALVARVLGASRSGTTAALGGGGETQCPIEATPGAAPSPRRCSTPGRWRLGAAARGYRST